MNSSKYLQLEKSKSGLLLKFRSLLASELDWYENEILTLFELKRIPKTNDQQLIEQILSKSPNDQKKKISQKQYYTSNALVFIRVLKKLLSEDFINHFESASEDKLVIYNYHRVLQNLLFDSLILLNEYAVNVKNIDPIYACGKNNHQHTLTLYQSLRQSIFGQASSHSFIEVEPDLSIAIIRQIVELRIRRAFGILGWYDSTSDSIQPLAASLILDAIKKHSSNIDLSIPIDNIIRIYGWANIFLHTGDKEYCWKHIFVTDYIQEFAIGNKNSVNIGIKLSQAVLDDIVSELETNNNKGLDVLRCPSQAEITSE